MEKLVAIIKDKTINMNFSFSRLNSNNIDVEKLIFLQNLRREAPEFFFNTIKNEYQLAKLDNLMLFINAFKNLP